MNAATILLHATFANMRRLVSFDSSESSIKAVLPISCSYAFEHGFELAKFFLRCLHATNEYPTIKQVVTIKIWVTCEDIVTMLLSSPDRRFFQLVDRWSQKY